MSNKVNEALFELIQSMTKSEKRYFKLLSSRHSIGGENNYIRIFDALEKMKTYEEKVVFKMFKGEAFLNRFSITKKRLYDNILSALDAFHSSKSIDSQLFKMLHSVDILHDKSLYDQSKRILRSAEKLAQKHQKKEIELLIINKQQRLIETSGNLHLTKQIVSAIEEQTSNCITELEVYNILWSIKAELFLRLANKGVSRSDKDIEEYEGIIRKLDSLELSKIKSNESQYLYSHIKSAYFYAIGNLEKALGQLNESIRLFAEEGGANVDSNKKLSTFTNAIYISDKIGDYRSSLSYLSNLKSMTQGLEANEDLSIKLFSSISSIELNLNLRKGDFKNALKLSKIIEEKLTEFDDKIVPIRRAFLEFKIAVIHIGMKDFSEALRWVNKILNDSDLDKTEDLIGYTQLLDLLIHIELNNQQLLPYSLKNTLRFFKTRNRLYSFEKAYLNFISRLIKIDDEFEAVDLWAELFEELQELQDDAFESVALEYFDFKSWAESKIKNKSFDIIIREHYNNNIRRAS